MPKPLKARDLRKLGLRDPRVQQAVRYACREAVRRGAGREAQQVAIERLLRDPAALAADEVWGPPARMLAADPVRSPAVRRGAGASRRGPQRSGGPAPWRQWGAEIDAAAIEQMRDAAGLPVASAGALMPDAHVGYGLPIGGVLATEQAVIPYAVGVDIACRMRLTVLDWHPATLDTRRDALREALERETRFGTGAAFEPGRRRTHDVLDEDWTVSPVTARLKDDAWSQLATSGSGNHFVEFGRLVLERADLGLQPGVYLALLSHSGSRHPGLKVAEHYSRLAADLHPELPPRLRRLAWLDLRSDAGQEYWRAMELMGHYAAANHELIHRHVLAALGARAIAGVENHHNFAWREEHGGREVIVHRKGATPAGLNQLAVIPGSMATPGWVVRGLGESTSLRSASHGAGRAMGRAEARRRLQPDEVADLLRLRGVEVLGADLDEAPQAYKDIERVMAAQTELVRRVARFDPVLVRMAGGRLSRR
ncbi:MAG TPA: RtcB family protein [Candidatus Krumholzibacteria bacterium]|nr:RtcB family protein [Candidatus Krumholzibacteria bacterium]HPD71921.1 RtcB family protein [Candidatus Krumholzibacteria bacterium]HRY41146.1 RtcB family protein [Candidatus Krumholzibacteria bacterium]